MWLVDLSESFVIIPMKADLGASSGSKKLVFKLPHFILSLICEFQLFRSHLVNFLALKAETAAGIVAIAAAVLDERVSQL